jgi:uncharacterized protein YggL (DUF469 family)
LKKRLRKKKRVGDFREFGFLVGFRFSKQLQRDARNRLLDNYIQTAIEKNGLQFGGGGGADIWEGFVVVNKPRGSTDSSHQEMIERWLKQEPLIIEYYVSQMVDAWQGDYDKVPRYWKT